MVLVNKKNGFTLIEILVVVVILAIIGMMTIPNIALENNKANLEALSNQMSIIGNAVQNYASLDEGINEPSQTIHYRWPDQNNNCRDAIVRLVDSTYLIGISNQSAWYNNPYTTECGDATFTLSVQIDGVYAYQIKRNLGSVLLSSTNTLIEVTITYTIAKPSLLPILGDYIALLDNSTNTWDAQSKTIGNVSDVSYTFGKKASQAVYDIGLVCDFSGGICGSGIGNEILKPLCSSTPTFLVTGISQWGVTETINKWTYNITENSTRWLLDFSLDGSSPSEQTLWSYLTKCE